jgi:hypothetical protein
MLLMLRTAPRPRHLIPRTTHPPRHLRKDEEAQFLGPRNPPFSVRTPYTENSDREIPEVRLWGHRTWGPWNSKFCWMAKDAGLGSIAATQGRMLFPTTPPVPPSHGRAAPKGLSKRNERSWTGRCDEYDCAMDTFREQQKAHPKLKKFVKRTVSKRIYRDCCDPNRDICTWYRKIKRRIDRLKGECGRLTHIPYHVIYTS